MTFFSSECDRIIYSRHSEIVFCLLSFIHILNSLQILQPLLQQRDISAGQRSQWSIGQAGRQAGWQGDGYIYNEGRQRRLRRRRRTEGTEEDNLNVQFLQCGYALIYIHWAALLLTLFPPFDSDGGGPNNYRRSGGQGRSHNRT